MNKYEIEDIEYISNYAKNNFFNGKTFLITGSTGMIGSFLLKVISKITPEENIYLVSDKSSKLLAKYKGCGYNFFSYDDIYDINCDIDYIIHLASPTDSFYLSNYPIETIDFIYKKTKIIFDFSLLHNSKTIYVSSMEVYGEVFDDIPRNEDNLGLLSLKSTRNSYPEAKRMAELMAYSYVQESNAKIIIARLAQCFGAGTLIEDSRIFGYIARCVLNEEDIVLKTKGDSYGNYCYLADAILSFFYMFQKGKFGETYNVVNKETRTTIYSMACLIAKHLTGNKIKVLINESFNNLYPRSTNLNMNNLNLLSLGWTPRYNLIDMYRRMIDYDKK